jgi:CheY-like chemotaxis protein
MATTNHERVGKALDLLKDGLQPFVEREMKSQHQQLWLDQVRTSVADTQTHLFSGKGDPQWDTASLLAVMWNQWNLVFRKTLGQAERTLVSELRDVRNKWAHQKPFSSDDSYRALDSAGRLLTAVSAPQAEEVDKIKNELLRVRFDEQMRTEKRRSAGTAIESAVTTNLKPWREVVNPHKDVASGRYQQAEFAADLWQVHLGEGSDEYKNPAEFFRRTYLTQSLRQLLIGAVQRLSGQGGDPVVQLQTNFGGGKTHSMLALYHLFSGVPQGELAGIDEVLKDAGTSRPPKVNRVVLVGNKISPGNPVTKSAVSVAGDLKPDVIVLDLSLGDLTGFEVTRRLKSAGSAARIVFFSVHEGEEFVEAAVNLGAAGYVFKSQSPEDLTRAVQAASQGKTYFPPQSSRQG